MRITNRVVTEKYLRSINDITTRLDYLNNQAVRERSFMKVSENTPAAVKAFQIRKDLIRVDGYKNSVSHAQSMLTNAETSITNIQSLVQDAKDKILYGMNGTQSVDERRIVAQQLRNYQQEMLQQLNSNATDLYYFGGNSVDAEPFKLDTDGKLMYRYKDGADFKWIRVENLHTSPDPSAGPTDPSYELYKDLQSAGLFVDIGMGIRSENVPPSPAGAPYVDRNSVFTYTLTGLSVTGAGMVEMSDGTKVSNNIYDILGAVADAFEDSFVNKTGQQEDYTHDRVDELYGLLRKCEIGVQFSITEVGTKTQYLRFINQSLANRELDDKTRQQGVEGADLAEVIIYYTAQEVTYSAALQMGTKVIPMSIFNYMS
ncbi:MAG: hypothetical protein LBG71_00515 [Clostridiales Family XIII bacterium]|jgi:flagellar hook-associated protein 3 FlgL|nr:hypothetical protein [Clostridiales Family XIII bacterium]